MSPAFTAAILGELRAIVSEEVAKRKQDHTDHKDWNTKPFWITFALTAALVIVGAVYSFVAYLQWTAIREQSEVGRITARAAERSTEIAEQNLTQLERPWILIEPVELSNFLLTSLILAFVRFLFRLTYTMRNSGRTPAWIIGGIPRFSPVIFPIPEVPEFGPFEPTLGAVLAPKRESTGSTTIHD